MRHSWLTGILTGAAVGVVAFALTETIQAQGARPGAPQRIGCVNVARVFAEYQRAKDLNDELAQLQETLKAEEQTRRNKIDQVQAEIDTLGDNDATRTKRYEDLLKMQIDYKSWGEVMRAHVTRENSLWTMRVYEEILAAAKALAEREGYDMVLRQDEFQRVSMDIEVIMQQINSNQVLYTHPSLDLTQSVIDRLNEEYKTQPQQKMIYAPMPQ
jgi:Skp family chaperone for outer membrane proteins